MSMARRDLDMVELKAQRLETARVELILAILKARESGETYRDIGKAAGLSHARIVQLVQESKSYEDGPAVRESRAKHSRAGTAPHASDSRSAAAGKRKGDQED
jgi:hypothetical protein